MSAFITFGKLYKFEVCGLATVPRYPWTIETWPWNLIAMALYLAALDHESLVLYSDITPYSFKTCIKQGTLETGLLIMNMTSSANKEILWFPATETISAVLLAVVVFFFFQVTSSYLIWVRPHQVGGTGGCRIAENYILPNQPSLKLAGYLVYQLLGLRRRGVTCSLWNHSQDSVFDGYPHRHYCRCCPSQCSEGLDTWIQKNTCLRW